MSKGKKPNVKKKTAGAKNASQEMKRRAVKRKSKPKGGYTY